MIYLLTPTYKYISISEPLVGDDVPVSRLEGQLYRVLRVEHIEQIEGLTTNNQTIQYKHNYHSVIWFFFQQVNLDIWFTLFTFGVGHGVHWIC